MVTFRRNILESVEDLQLCVGQRSGYVAAIHTLSSIFNEKTCDVVLVIDTNNAFN